MNSIIEDIESSKLHNDGDKEILLKEYNESLYDALNSKAQEIGN